MNSPKLGPLLSFIVVCTCVFSAHNSVAQDLDYGTYSLFPQGSARAMGMGGAYTALSDDVMGIIYNPAGLALGDWKYDVGGTQNSVDNREFDFEGNGEGFGLPYKFIFYGAGIRLGSFALGVGYSQPFNVDIRDSIFGTEKQIQLTSGSVVLAKSFGKKLSVGVGGHYLTVKQSYKDDFFNYDESAEAEGQYLSYGAIYKTNKISIGVSMTEGAEVEMDKEGNANIGGNIWFRDIAFPSKFSLGVASKVSSEMLFTFDIDKYSALEDTILPGTGEQGDFSAEEMRNTEHTVLHGGIEWQLVKGSKNEVLWRLGTYREPKRFITAEERTHFTMGLEVRLGPAILSVAFDTAKNFKNNSAGFSLSFGKI